MRPIQPISRARDGIVRFEENKIVRFLLDEGPFDMNKIAVMDFSQEDMEQFAQLIGYSICGFSELSYVSNDTYNAAEKMANGTSEAQARIEALEDTLKTVRDGMRGPVAALYKICEEDLEV